MRAVFDHSEAEADNIRTFFFKPESPLRYTAGQFTELTVPHLEADNRGQKRWFTLSSSPSEALVSITTKFAGEASSSFKRALFNLQPGSEVSLAEAMGDFVLPKLGQTPLVFIAGGIGITPVHSILEWLATTGEERPIQLLYGVRNEDEIIFQGTFDKAGVHATIVVENPSAAWGGERGHLDAELITGLIDVPADALVYLSGPEVMVQSLKRDLSQHGVSPSQIVVDEFPNYQAI
jgi:ferredoxin-NADP reductase